MSETDPALRRDIGFTGSAFLSFNGIVGAGIFALPAALHLQFGVFSPWLFPIFGLLILLVALPFARLAAYFQGSGGPVAYAAAFGPLAAFQVGWIYYVARTSALAANANVFATYAATLWAPLGAPAGRVALIVGLIGTVTWVNLVGVRRAIRALDALTLLKAAPLVALAIWGLAVAAEGVPPPGPPPPLSAFEAAALITLYAFIGFENSVVPAGETADPRRTIPRALVTTVAMTALLYFVVQLAYVAVMPAGGEPDAPLVAFATVVWGPIGGVLLVGAALSSIGGNLMGSVTSTPRITYALARDGLLPAWFGLVSRRWHTPSGSILFMGGLGIVLAITGSFTWLAIVSTLARLIVYAASIAALPAAARAAGGRPGAGTALLMFAGIAVCLWAAFQSRAESWAMLAGLLVLGLILYAVARRAASAGTVSSIQPPPSTRSPS
jgi:basic amino acid/polyamine antiporter, APA family